MLLDAFGLQRDPFLDTADPAFYFETMATASNRRRLFDCLAAGRGLAVVLGPVGVGKTTLCNAVTAQLLADPHCIVGLILDPTFESETAMLDAIAGAFGFASLEERSADPRRHREHLKRCLFEATVSTDRQAILLIDEAQALPEALLETLRTLLNFQLDERKLLSIGLAGQVEMAAAIARRPNLSDRVALWLDLRPLTEAEAAGLIDHRLRCAGYAAERSPFPPEAMHDLWLRSNGLPRRLGALARASLEVAAERSARSVSLADIADAARRLPPMSAAHASAESATSVALGGVATPQKPRPWWRLWNVAS
jgi:type II secretory pathway predicted ATPase ExeA